MINRSLLLVSASLLALSAGPAPAQQQGGQAGQSGGAQITVQQPQPQVQVQQPAPEITVQQPQPQVTVQQPPPQVTVEQPEPQVTVQQAEPKVEVQRQGQPQVNVQREGQPQVNVQTEGQPGAAARAGASPLMSMQASDIRGKDVVNAQGEDIGDVDEIVMSNQDRRLYAVISTGGVLGIGAQEVVVPLEELQLQEDNLMLPGATGEQLRNRTSYNETEYQTISGDQRLNAIR